MYHIRLIGQFIRLSTQVETAHRTNFYISLLHTFLGFATGLLGVTVLFGQVDTIQGWNFDSTLVVLGVYLTVGAIQGLFISPSLEALAGLGGELWSGRFDYTLLRPVNTQFLVSVRFWRPLTLFDLALGLGTLVVAVSRLEQSLTLIDTLRFVVALSAGLMTLYAILLFFTALLFWSPGILFTWIFNAIFQMGRYPVGVYPGWLRLVLTWIIPIGIITTIPAQALVADLPSGLLFGSLTVAVGLLIGGSMLFRTGLRRYASASS
jgi:ABC-2 type transport system permease protein